MALDGPIPWRAEACARAGTVHVGGTYEEIVASEQAMASGRVAERPFVLVAQQSLFDATRAPVGKHTVWAYCHVPSGSDVDMTDRIEAQIERFAPGFRDRILADAAWTRRRSRPTTPTTSAATSTAASRTCASCSPGLAEPGPLCHAQPEAVLLLLLDPAGGGVHGMCGYFAAQTALKRVLR